MKIANIVVRIVLSAIAYIVSLVLMGTLSPLLHLPPLKPVPGGGPQQMFLTMVLALPILILGMLPLASFLKGSWPLRWLAIAVLLYVTLGLNTLIEAKIFTGLLEGNPLTASFFWIVPSALTAAALTFGLNQSNPAPSAMGNFSPSGWAWRLGVAWLAFPPIYFVFGMCVAPFVVPYYNSTGILGLKIPGFDVIIRTQLLRSAIFLAASFPAILLWTKSRGRLILALGLAHAVTVGVFQLAQASFLPMTLRIAHSLEITADSFAYAAVLTLLFVRSTKVAQPVLAKPATAA